MAFSDISALVSKPENHRTLFADPGLVMHIIEAILKKLDDDVTDVQSQAVKCLQPLMAVVHDDHVEALVQALYKRASDPPSNKVEDTLSITYMALRTVVDKAPIHSSTARILAKGLHPLFQKETNWNIDSMDIIIDYLSRYGGILPPKEIELIEGYLTKIISAAKGIVRKRAVAALGELARHLSTPRFNNLIQFVSKQLDESGSAAPASVQTFVLLAGTLAKADPVRFKSYLPTMFGRIVECLQLARAKAEYDEEDVEEEEDESLLETRQITMSTLDAFVALGSASESYLGDLIDVIMTFISYDPNYNDLGEDEEEGEEEADFSKLDAGGDDDVEMADSMEEEDVDFGDEFDDYDAEDMFSDDGDQNWKLRRMACKLTSSIVRNMPRQLPTVYSQLLVPVLKRVSSERETSVRIDAINTMAVFISAASLDSDYYKLKAHHHLSDEEETPEVDPRAQLASIVRKLVFITTKEVSRISNASSDAANVARSLFNGVLYNLVASLGPEIEQYFDRVVNLLVILTKKRDAPQQLLQQSDDILRIISVMLRNHPFEVVSAYVPSLVDLIVATISQENVQYKVIGLALDVSNELVDMVFMSKRYHEFSFGSLEKCLQERALSTQLDSETREKAIIGLGRILPLLETNSGGAEVLLGLISNELLRLAAISAIEMYLRHAALIGFANIANSPAPAWDGQVLGKLTPLLKMSSRSLRVSTLTTITRVVSVQSLEPVTAADEVVETATALVELVRALTEASGGDSMDSTSLSLALEAITVLYSRRGGAEAIDASSSDISSKLCAFIVSVVKQGISVEFGQVQDVLVKLTSAIVANSKAVDPYKAMYEPLMAGVAPGGANEPALAKVVGALLAHDRARLEALFQEVAQPHSPLKDAKIIKRNLMVVGNAGRINSSWITVDLWKRLFSSVAQVGNAEADHSTRLVAAQTAGVIACGRPDMFGHLVESLGEPLNNEDGEILLTALREAIVTSPIGEENTSARDTFEWNAALDGLIQLQAQQSASYPDSEEDRERFLSIISECAGRLGVLVESSYLDAQLDKLLTSGDYALRLIGLSVIKHMVGSKEVETSRLEPLVNALMRLVSGNDTNIKVQQMVYSIVVIGVPNKPEEFVPHLPHLMQPLYNATIPDDALIREVQIGPFKHKVDDGLELRKTAYELVYTLTVNLNPSQLDRVISGNDLYRRVLAGLQDDHDIKTMCLSIVGRLAQTNPMLITRAESFSEESQGGVVELIQMLSALLNVTLKDNAVKQEVEKQGEVIRSVVRTAKEINEHIRKAPTVSDPTEHVNGSTQVPLMNEKEIPAWDKFYLEIERTQKNM
ncbi:hypothetical protein TRVA0_021S02256 [Trichomonascus vanleenenianus]|uniref:TIP120 domain-containing protein n=1 Tax=Trichomonascus vanleenenianus TaxID=2268995 RepID=UPI003ECB4571